MKIRQNHPILDRIKLIVILSLVLLFLWYLAGKGQKENCSNETASIEYLIENSLKPVGSTMYIWGGGWDDADSKSGTGSAQIGLSPQWEVFASQQDETYDFEEHRFERENGLDCSGYVGWVIYNTFESRNGQSGYVTTSTDLAESLANRGWGTLLKNPKEFFPGDIVSMEGHVWICLGACSDGSILLVHSSPPGVSVCGTGSPKGATDDESIAVKLATEFMTMYHPNWQEKYPSRTVSNAYFENISVFRWNENIMLDAKEMQKLSAEEIFVYISPDI